MKLGVETLQALLELAPQAIIIVDQDSRIVFANARTEDLFGYDRDELLGQPVDVLLSESAHRVHNTHRTRIIYDPHTRPMSLGLDLTARRKDGTVFPVEIGLSAIETDDRTLVTSYITDITPHQQVEEQLRKLNTRLEKRTRQLTALHEIGRTLAATLDLREIYWVMFQEIAKGLLGASHLIVALYDGEAKTIFCGFAIVDDTEMDPSQFPPILLGEGPVSDTIRTREPRIVDLEKVQSYLEERGRGVQIGDERQAKSVLYVPMVGGDEVVGVMHIQHYKAKAFRETDLPLLSILASQAAVAITNAQLFAKEQDRAEALARALAQQRELDRLKSEFIQNVSHELRTPLGIAHGYAELLESGALGQLQADHQQAVNTIARRIRVLRKIVEDFGTIFESGTKDSKPEPVHLAELIEPLIKEYRAAAERAELALTTDVASDLPPLFGDPAHLARVVDNLLSNALKFTPTGGRISVRLWQEKDKVALEIADTGVGIPPQQLDRIFDRFYQVDGSTTRRYGGTGLGLALVKEIVEAHGGQVSVESTLGQGSTFQVRLPLKWDASPINARS